VLPIEKEDEIATSVSKSDRRLRYRGPYFSAASALLIDGGVFRFARLVGFLAAALRRPSRLAALTVLLLRTESLPLSPSDSLPGRALRAHFNDRSLGLVPRNQFCQGVLLLPRDHAAYLRGRRRQALRTNLRKAATAGISCDAITDPSRGLDHLLEILGDREGTLTEEPAKVWRTRVAQPELTLVVAQGQHGRALAIAGVVVDDMTCLIQFAIASNHEARWALHDHLVRALIARGVRYLVSEGGGLFGALGFEPNVQHYQHLLGYELRHLTLSTPQVFRRKRRVAACAAIALMSVTLTSATLLAEAAAATGRHTIAPLTADFSSVPCRQSGSCTWLSEIATSTSGVSGWIAETFFSRHVQWRLRAALPVTLPVTRNTSGC
jgi:hypothetical protein